MGDCAARGADLFESIAAEIISAMILGGTMAKRCKLDGKFPYCVCVFEVRYSVLCSAAQDLVILQSIHH